MCRPLGWLGTGLWLAISALTFQVASTSSTHLGGGRGCDGGLCILGYVFPFIVWLGACSVTYVFLVKFLPEEGRRWWGKKDSL